MNIDLPVEQEIKQFDAKMPIFKLKVNNYPATINGEVFKNALDITYIKLSVDEVEAKKGQYGLAVKCQISKTATTACGKRPNRDQFPQRTTADQNFDPIQFNAYRDLGCRTVEIFLTDDLNPNPKPDWPADSSASRCYGANWYGQLRDSPGTPG